MRREDAERLGFRREIHVEADDDVRFRGLAFETQAAHEAPASSAVTQFNSQAHSASNRSLTVLPGPYFPAKEP